MIVHRYSEWQEPEKPPFSLEDLIKAISELMMRASVSFDEALRHMLRQGLPLRQFMSIKGLDTLVDSLIQQLQQMKAQLRQQYDLDKLVQKLRQEAEKEAGKLRRAHPEVDDALHNYRTQPLYRLRWSGVKGQDAIERLLDRLKLLEPLDEFARQERFSGSQPLEPQQALRLKGRFQAIDNLIQELERALESGDLEAVNIEALEKLLGREATADFNARRDELMGQLTEAMEATGLVERGDDGLFKLTPGAARKLGEFFLQAVFTHLRTDGLGKHAAALPGEGSVESVATRPMEYGDSLSHVDLPSTLVNAVVRSGTGFPIRMKPEDFEVFDTRGAARSAIVVMIDQSGSMTRFGRFYNAQRLALALDALIRTHYPEDRLHFVGFATYAKRVPVGDVLNLKPKPVTYVGSTVRMKVEFTPDMKRRGVPEYFTNLQKGLELARVLLSREDTRNKRIILITDGAPTAYYEGTALHLTYPPTERTYQCTLREVKRCTEDRIVISTFMMAGDFDFGYFGEEQFLNKMLKTNRGKLFYPRPDRLTQYVLVDFMQEKRKLLQI